MYDGYYSADVAGELSVDDVADLFNRIFDVEAKKIAEEEGRPYEQVRAESHIVKDDTGVDLYMSPAMKKHVDEILKKYATS